MRLKNAARMPARVHRLRSKPSALLDCFAGAIWDLGGLGGWLFKGRVLGTLRERLENDRED